MESKKLKIAVIGGGASGVISAISAKRQNFEVDVTIFEKEFVLKTILPTGGGRCNLTFDEPDIKAFAANYPRGEKFLYSVFNSFFVPETLEFFKSIGVETYVQADSRVFPVTDSAKSVREAMMKKIFEYKIKMQNEEVKNISKFGDFFMVNNEKFDRVIISAGGRYKDTKHSGFALASKLGHSLTTLKPSLSGFETVEEFPKKLSGLSFKQISCLAQFEKKKVSLKDDLLFTHKGVSGPVIYKASSLFAFDDYSTGNPLILSFNFINMEADEAVSYLQKLFDTNPKKSLINIISDLAPKSFCEEAFELFKIEWNKKGCEVSKLEKTKIAEFLTDFKLHVTNPLKDGEIVTAGGVSLKEINSKTMESKLVKGLFFAGEVLDIDGFCGGFNLQNAWSTGFIAGKNSAIAD